MLYNPEQFPLPEERQEEQGQSYKFSSEPEITKLLENIGVHSIDELSPEQEKHFRINGKELFEKEAMPYGNRELLTIELAALLEHRVDVTRIAAQDPRILYIYSHCKALEGQGKLTGDQIKAYIMKYFGWQSDTPVDMREIDEMLAASSVAHRKKILEQV